MKKCGILSFLRTTNYGAVLQCYALQYKLKTLGVDAEVIDYRSKVLTSRYEKKNFLYYINPKYLLKIFLRNSYIRDNRCSFNLFIENFISVSSNFYDELTIKKTDLIYDFFIVGSDQVWNPLCMGWDKNFLLTFSSPSKRNSYAASFGIENVDSRLLNWFVPELKNFCNVSVRENTGTVLYNKITGKRCAKVLDPTLLLHQEWYDIATKVDCLQNTPYVLVYVLKESKNLFEQAKRYGRLHNAKVVYINDRLLKTKGVDNLFYVSPQEWLYLFQNASCVFTNSFHGTIFSVNFNKEFWVELLPPPSKVNSRIVDFLKELSLNGRIINEGTDFSNRIENYDYINEVLLNLKKQSLNFLKQVFICQ